MVGGLWGNSRNLAALFGLSFGARVTAMALDQDLAVAAASSELIVGIVARMALDGATIPLETVQYALAALTRVQALQHALAVHPAPHPAPHPALLEVVVVASGVVTVVIAAMMARVGATSRAPIVQHVQGTSTAVLGHQHAGEFVEPDKPSGGSPTT